MLTKSNLQHPLISIELQLRSLLPADLYARVWTQPTPDNLSEVFQHLRTLQYILQDYVPKQVSDKPPKLGILRHTWQEGTLLFTDLAGFTTLTEANASYGQAGAQRLLSVLNRYFSEMIEILGKSGGDLLEFTGDALLAQFLSRRNHNHTAQAVRAGLRMQRAMQSFSHIDIAQQTFCLGMRVGVHPGKFLTADIGTPMRRAHVLMGNTVQMAKRAEGAGRVGRVCLTPEAVAALNGKFHYETLDNQYTLVKDDLSDEELGEYDITFSQRRMSSPLLFDRSVEGLLTEIRDVAERIEPLACYLPQSVLNVLVENAAQRQIPPQFIKATVLFVNLIGLPESIDRASPEEIEPLVNHFSMLFARINAEVKARGGILQKVTYHSVGSDILIYFGVINSHFDDDLRAAETAIAVRDLVNAVDPVAIAQESIKLTCRIGMTYGSVFASEIGEPRGRREFNVLSDTVNTASRLTSHAEPNQILISEQCYNHIANQFQCEFLGEVALKGKTKHAQLYSLLQPHPPGDS